MHAVERAAQTVFGDTAQTISRGVGFRFADVKQLLYRHGDKVEPTVHQLSCNYRTHHGIVLCSSLLVSLMLKLFPNSIDALIEPERGHFPGPPPALLPDVDAASLVESMLAADDVGATEMGANQAVLVRNDDAKTRLPPELRNGLVLTVEESKGLEFDVVVRASRLAHSTLRACARPPLSRPAPPHGPCEF